MQIGRRIYYEIANGNVITNTGERSGNVIETTIEQDFTTYVALAERVPSTVGIMQLGYGQYAEDFAQCSGYRVDLSGAEPTLLFSYPDHNEPEPPPVYRPPLSAEVEQIKDEQLTLKLALTELAEASEADKTEIQLALIELAEIIAGGA